MPPSPRWPRCWPTSTACWLAARLPNRTCVPCGPAKAGGRHFAYLGAPPISEDDLETLAETRFSPQAASAEHGERLLAVMRVIVDPRRFPWIAQQRAAVAAEQQAATLATTSLLASQRIQTLRRGDEKAAVEGAVKGLLVGMGWQAASSRPPRGVQKLVTDAPAARTFLTQTNLGADNADVIVRLDDGRLLAIECKGSTSEINSRKRLNKEAVQNARAWLAGFGAEQVVPAVALQGVFKARCVAEAQDTPMAVFWSHRLDDLRRFIAAAASPAAVWRTAPRRPARCPASARWRVRAPRPR